MKKLNRWQFVILVLIVVIYYLVDLTTKSQNPLSIFGAALLTLMIFTVIAGNIKKATAAYTAVATGNIALAGIFIIIAVATKFTTTTLVLTAFIMGVITTILVVGGGKETANNLKTDEWKVNLSTSIQIATIYICSYIAHQLIF